MNNMQKFLRDGRWLTADEVKVLTKKKKPTVIKTKDEDKKDTTQGK